MQYILVFIAILGILTGGCAVTSNRPQQLTEPQAYQCIRAALEQELKAGSQPDYEPGIELEAPFRQCWQTLDPVAKRVYAPMLVEAALEQGVTVALAEGCRWTLKYGQESPTGKKCRLLKEIGFQLQNYEQ